MITALGAVSAWPQSPPKDLANESLEDLMTIEVTSVSKQEQKVSRTAAAIFVITAEDIRRSGATNIPDLLRMVPGVDVAQIDSNTWAISVRGLNGRFSNDLLVMVDGRSVYTPTFGGVFWDALDMPLEDIERIEVIRGPGGAIWGVNAVNGVVNIITKKAGATHGVTAEAGGGNLDEGFGTLQYGGTLGARTDYRIYGRYLNQDHMAGLTGPDGGDGWHMLRGGFRVDTALSSKDSLTVQGDTYEAREGQAQPYLASLNSPLQIVETEVDLAGGFLQGIWNHTFSPRSDMTLQVSYQNYARGDVLREHRGSLDVDFQDHFRWGARQNLVWGADYRDSNSTTVGTLAVALNPPNLTDHLFSAFVQDELAVVQNRLYVTVGTKLEHDYYNGFSWMPSASAVWTPNERQTVWASVSHAVRADAAVDASLRLNVADFPGAGGTTDVVAILGNPKLGANDLVAYEAGYRTTLTNRLSLDLAMYYNDYTHLRTTEPVMPFFETTPAPPHLVLPMMYEDLMFGETHGLEIFANWKVLDRWTLSPGYEFEEIHMHLDPQSQDTTSVGQAQGGSPAHSAQLRSHFVLPRSFAWDASLYFVNRITDPDVHSYTRLDTGLSWQWKEGVVVSLVGQNLLQDRHLEYVDFTQSAASSLIKRSAYAKVTWTH